MLASDLPAAQLPLPLNAAGRNAPSYFKTPLNTEDRAPRYEYKNAAQREGPVPRIHKTQFHATKGHDGAERHAAPRDHHTLVEQHVHSSKGTLNNVQRLEAQVVRPRVESPQSWTHSFLHET